MIKRSREMTRRCSLSTRMIAGVRALVAASSALPSHIRSLSSHLVAQLEQAGGAPWGSHLRDAFDDEWEITEGDDTEWAATPYTDTDWSGPMEEPTTNPATGMSMSGGIDAGGNLYGWSDWSADSGENGL
jgi:hypothetical protein